VISRAADRSLEGALTDTALYYTLSTVSQTLAGALGMLAAFLALRVSALDGPIRDLRLWARLAYPPLQPAAAQTEPLLTAAKAWFAANGGDPVHRHVGQTIDEAQRAYGARTTLLQQAKSAFAGSALVMGCCFVALACTPWLSSSEARAWTVAAVAIISGIACLVWYGRIVRAALD
jgi:hypothetical protein